MVNVAESKQITTISSFFIYLILINKKLILCIISLFFLKGVAKKKGVVLFLKNINNE
jgi:hypothetical protein